MSGPTAGASTAAAIAGRKRRDADRDVQRPQSASERFMQAWPS
jgi:hypothetical protein